MTWLYVTAALTATPMSEAQCKAIAAKVETHRGNRMAACLSPAGDWWPTEVGPIAPKKIQVARK
jgi:hypothetical protein